MKGIIGIDLSITSTGFFIEGSAGYRGGVIKTSPQDGDFYKRATIIMMKLDELIRQYPDYLIAIESPAYGARGAQSYVLFGIHFLACTLFYKHGREAVQFSPTSIKKFATGKGNSKKDIMFESLPEDIKLYLEKLGLKKSTGLYDATDAYWIAQYLKDRK